MKWFFLLSFSILLLSSPVMASEVFDGEKGSAYQILTQSRDQIGLQRETLPVRLGRYINAVLGTLGIVGVMYFTFGAYKYLTSAGASDKIENAKGQMIYTVIGMLILLLAYALTRFVLTAVLGAAG